MVVDGKIILRKDIYIFNGIFPHIPTESPENMTRKDALLSLKTFEGSVGAKKIFDHIKTLDRDLLEKIFVIVADTTSVNSGCLTGVFRQARDYFKSEFNRDVHTVECQLHVIELFFKHFFLYVEGPSKAPDKLPKGSLYNLIGKTETAVKSLKPADFIKLPDLSKNELVV